MFGVVINKKIEKVKTQQPCPICEGLGEQYNADWLDYISACTHSGNGEYLSHTLHQTDFFHFRGYSIIPNIVETCTCCNGKGQVMGSINKSDLKYLPVNTASELGVCSKQLISSGRL